MKISVIQIPSSDREEDDMLILSNVTDGQMDRVVVFDKSPDHDAGTFTDMGDESHLETYTSWRDFHNHLTKLNVSSVNLVILCNGQRISYEERKRLLDILKEKIADIYVYDLLEFNAAKKMFEYVELENGTEVIYIRSTDEINRDLTAQLINPMLGATKGKLINVNLVGGMDFGEYTLLPPEVEGTGFLAPTNFYVADMYKA